MREWLKLYAQRAWLKLLLLLVAWVVWEAMKNWLFGFLNSWLEAQQFSINEWLLPAIEYLRQNPAILSLFVPVSALTVIIYKTYRKLEAERLLENGKTPPLKTEAEPAPTMEQESTEATSVEKLLEEDGPGIEIHFEGRPPFKEYVEPRRPRVALQSDRDLEGIALVVKRLVPEQDILGDTAIPLKGMHDSPYINQDGRLRTSFSLVSGKATYIDVVSKDLDTRLLSLEHTRQSEGPHLFKDGVYVLELETTGPVRVSRDFVLRVPTSGQVLFYPLDPPPTRDEGLGKLA